jgi:probable HAF family extracellular repeat protein
MTSHVRLFAALCLTAAASAHAAQPRYSLESLGEYWVPVGIGSGHQFIGHQTIQNNGVIYQDGVINGLTGRGRSFATAINSHGAVVGNDVNLAGVSQATLWLNYWEPKALGGLPGGIHSYAAGINDAGHVVGASNYGPDEMRTFAVIWKNGRLKSLGSLPGSDNSGASAINAKGQIVGWASTPVTQHRHAVRWTGGVIEDLGFLPGASNEYSYATGINRRGDVIGNATSPTGPVHPFLIRAGSGDTMVDLGTLYGGASEVCEAAGINNAREIVGSCVDHVALKDGAFIYRGGRLQPLDRYLDSSGAGWHVYGAHAIDDLGRVLAVARDPEGHWHPVLLKPVAAER